MKLKIIAVVIGLTATAGVAQTRSERDTATAYGARLTAKGQPTDLNRNRVNNRIDNRIYNRLSLRVERYQPDSADNPTAAYRTIQDDKSRIAPPSESPQRQQQDETQ